MLGDTTADGFYDQVIGPDPNDAHWLVGNIHRRGANILFLDGHVQWNLQSELTVKYLPVPEESSRQQLWNADGKPSRDW